MRMRRPAALALAAVLAAGLAACGDDDDSADEASRTEADSGSVTEEDSDDGSDSGDSDLGAGFAGAGCAEFAQEFAEANAAIGGAFAGGGEGDFGEVADFFEEAANDAPDEVSDALQVLAGAYREFAEALDEADVDFSDPNAFSDPEVVAALTEASEAFNDPEIQEANQTLEAFAANSCEG